MNTSAIDTVLADYGLERRGEPQPIAAGTLNENYRVETTSGAFFVRRHRDGVDVERVAGEHSVIGFVAEAGIPVARPCETTRGKTVVAHDNGCWAVFPWVGGRMPVRGAITPEEAFALGGMHGRIQAALRDHPLSADAQFTMRWEKAETLAILAKCLELARERRMPLDIVDAIAFQHGLLERTDIEPPESFAQLPCQLIHGDYHDQQVIFDPNGAIAAVTDWEMYQPGSRVWEVIRALGFARILHTPLADDYLRGYRQHMSLGEDEIRMGVQLWWQSRVGGSWVWYAYFIEGNGRVAEFFPAIVPGLKQLADPASREHLTDRLIRAAR